MKMARYLTRLGSILTVALLVACSGQPKLGQYPHTLLDDRASLEVQGPIQSLSVSVRLWDDTQQVWQAKRRIREVHFTPRGFTLEDILFGLTGQEVRRLHFNAEIPTGVEYLKAGRRTASYQFQYNDNGDLTKQKSDTNVPYTNDVTYEYGKRWILRRSSVPQRPLQRRSELTLLDKNGVIVEYYVTEQPLKSIKEFEVIVPEHRERYERDQAGQLLRHEIFKHGQLNSVETYNYNESGHLQQSNVYEYKANRAKQKFRTLYFDYELDNQDNWVQRTKLEEERRGQFWYQRQKTLQHRRLTYF
ncbi:MAG TPA: hypothetical protein DCZ03_00465 [Gammaproteobacteria bacterium]|nr:hypothetical protein [Gammaproteobacteria bacterium]